MIMIVMMMIMIVMVRMVMTMIVTMMRVYQCHLKRVIWCPWIRKQQLLSKQSTNLQFQELFKTMNYLVSTLCWYISVYCCWANCWKWFGETSNAHWRADQKQIMVEPLLSNSTCKRGNYLQCLQNIDFRKFHLFKIVEKDFSIWAKCDKSGWIQIISILQNTAPAAESVCSQLQQNIYQIFKSSSWKPGRYMLEVSACDQGTSL